MCKELFVNYSSGVQSYCPSNLEYSEDVYNSLYHYGKGETPDYTKFIQIKGFGDLNSKSRCEFGAKEFPCLLEEKWFARIGSKRRRRERIWRYNSFQTLFCWPPMHCLPDHISTSIDIAIPVDYRLSTQFELVVFMAEVFHNFTSLQVAHSNAIELSRVGRWARLPRVTK